MSEKSNVPVRERHTLFVDMFIKGLKRAGLSIDDLVQKTSLPRDLLWNMLKGVEVDISNQDWKAIDDVLDTGFPNLFDDIEKKSLMEKVELIEKAKKLEEEMPYRRVKKATIRPRKSDDQK